MSCGVFWAREGAVLVKFTQGDIRYMPGSGGGMGLFMIRGGDSEESVRGRGWRRRESYTENEVPAGGVAYDVDVVGVCTC